MKFSYEPKIKAENTKFLAKLKCVRKAKAIAQLKCSDSKDDMMDQQGLVTSVQGLNHCPVRDFT